MPTAHAGAESAESGGMLPFSEHPDVLALAPKMREAEDAVCRSEAGARGKLADLVEEQKQLVTRLREERCAESGNVDRCRKKVAEGDDSAKIYDAVFNKVQKEKGFKAYEQVAAEVQAAVPPPSQCTQRTADCSSLYEDAVAIRPRSRALLEEINQHTNAELQKMGPLKRMRCAGARSATPLEPLPIGALAPSAAAFARRWCSLPTVPRPASGSATSCATCSRARRWRRSRMCCAGSWRARTSRLCASRTASPTRRQAGATP